MNPIIDPLLCGYLHGTFDFNNSDIRRFPHTVYLLMYKFIAPVDLNGMIKYQNDTEDEYKEEIGRWKKVAEDLNLQLIQMNAQLKQSQEIIRRDKHELRQQDWELRSLRSQKVRSLRMRPGAHP